jgi:UDP-glucose 4-epimerase
VTAPIVAITGANGAIGPVVAEELARAGYDVRALARRDADVLDRDALRRAFDGATGVVHLAAKLHIVDPPPSLQDEYRRVNVDGTANVIRAASEAGVRRVIHVSTIAVYGYNDGRVLSEGSETRPDTFYSRTKLESEKIALDANAAVLRFAAVYGSRVKGNYRKLLHSIGKGHFIPLGKGKNRRTLVYDRDAARAVVLALKSDASAGQIFNVTDGSFHTVREILDAMAAALGRRVPRVSMPLAPIRFGIGIAERSLKMIGMRSPVTRSMIDKYAEDVTVSSDKIRDVLGYRAEYDLERGWRETVELMRRAGEL